jgi:hypothetical protein
LTLPGIHQQIFPSLVAPIPQSRLFLGLQVKSSAKDVAADPKNKNKKVFRDGPVVIELFAGSGRLTA